MIGGVMTDDELRSEVLRAIVETKSDFRTTDSLVKQFSLRRWDVVGALDELWRSRRIRHPIGWERNAVREQDYWRDANRGETRQEKRRKWLAVIGFYPLSLGYYHGGSW